MARRFACPRTRRLCSSGWQSHACLQAAAPKPGRACAGVRQLLWADVHGERMHFQPLYAWLAGEVVFSADRARLDTLPPQCRAKLLLVMAAFTPYYTPPQARTSKPRRWASVLRRATSVAPINRMQVT